MNSTSNDKVMMELAIVAFDRGAKAGMQVAKDFLQYMLDEKLVDDASGPQVCKALIAAWKDEKLDEKFLVRAKLADIKKITEGT